MKKHVEIVFKTIRKASANEVIMKKAEPNTKAN